MKKRIHYFNRNGDIEPIPGFVCEDVIFRQNKFLNKFKEIVQECGFTYEELAKAFHCSVGTIHRYMHNDPNVVVKPELFRFMFWFTGPVDYDIFFDTDDVEV